MSDYNFHQYNAYMQCDSHSMMYIASLLLKFSTIKAATEINQSILHVL